MAKVRTAQEQRRKKALMFKESKGGQDSISKINKNFKALQSLDKKDINSLSHVIENSIVFTLSK
jgi:hypothetical protein